MILIVCVCVEISKSDMWFEFKQNDRETHSFWPPKSIKKRCSGSCSFQPILGRRVFKQGGANSENGEIRSKIRSEQRWWASDDGYGSIPNLAMPGIQAFDPTRIWVGIHWETERICQVHPVKTMRIKIPVFFHEYVEEHTEIYLSGLQ